MKSLLIIFLCFLMLTSCSDKAKEAELQARISELEQQIDDCQNGSEKLLSKLNLAYEEENFQLVKSIYTEIKNRHPETPEYVQANATYEKIIAKEEEAKRKEEARLEEERAEKLRALNKLKKEFDDVSGVTWYKQPYFNHYVNTFLSSIYVGDEDGRQWIRLKMTYTGSDWIFFEKAYLSYDGNTLEIPFNEYSEKETDNSGGGIWEWIDVSVSGEMIPFLREFGKSENAKMRFVGKYTKTRNLSRNERQGFLDVLNGYDLLKSGINK